MSNFKPAFTKDSPQRKPFISPGHKIFTNKHTLGNDKAYSRRPATMQRQGGGLLFIQALSFFERGFAIHSKSGKYYCHEQPRIEILLTYYFAPLQGDSWLAHYRKGQANEKQATMAVAQGLRCRGEQGRMTPLTNIKN